MHPNVVAPGRGVLFPPRKLALLLISGIRAFFDIFVYIDLGEMSVLLLWSTLAFVEDTRSLPAFATVHSRDRK